MNPATPLLPSLDLIRRVTKTALAYTLARMQILERIPGNPIGISYRPFDDGAALMARDLPSASFNSVVGLRAGRSDHIQPLVEWYRAKNSAAQFEIAAGDYDLALGQELLRLGFLPSGFHAALIAAPNPDISAVCEASIRRVESASDFEDFLAAYVAGWGVPAGLHDQFKNNVRAWFEQPDWMLYVARANGRPVAAAILYIHGGVGYFADCATDPIFRNKGVHAALLRRRLKDASDAGVDFVCSGADFLSTSHRNIERVGMRILFLRTVFTSPAAQS
jgi:GNAT superfamily N-acetyltransferase